MSAATIDRRLRLYKPKLLKGLSTTKPGTLLKKQVPVHTYTPWDEQRPGFVEIDLVAHCGISTAGHYLNSLVVTDIATGWTECIGVWGKGQMAVYEALKNVRERLPFPLLGIDSDNGSEFLNDHLVRWCKLEKITFTRSRPYEKNDQAHVEQKNWSIVRRLIGYDRYETEEALSQLNLVYRLMRIWVNHWQPVLKLIGKERRGARVIKHYDRAQTPHRRVLEAGVLSDRKRSRQEEDHGSWGPSALRKEQDKAIEKLWELSQREDSSQRVACG
ncbi:MAG: transposase family protein [Dehalococcoidia bacterium]|nr:transposase family protein [Dehalococcoidia bacterium]